MDSSSPASTRRAVDLLPPNPTAQSDYRPTEVLALGLSRTATMSMHAALTKLGHKTYHFMEVGQRDLVAEGKPREDHIACWTEAFEAKIYDGGRIEYGKDEFERLLRRYSAVTDAPCACFSDELLEAYPQAKVILTNRDPMKWLASMETAYYRILESEDWKWFRALADLDFKFLGRYLVLLKYPLLYWTNGDWQNRKKLLQTFDLHYAHIREVVPPECLLEWSPGDGWEPLCKFLSVPVPNEPFPHINKGASAADLHKQLGYVRAVMLLGEYLARPAKVLAALGVGAIALWWYRKT